MIFGLDHHLRGFLYQIFTPFPHNVARFVVTQILAKQSISVPCTCTLETLLPRDDETLGLARLWFLSLVIGF